MVKRRYHKSSQGLNNKGFIKGSVRPRKINASTAYETCSEQLSPFGGLLALIKFIDLVEFTHFYASLSATDTETQIGTLSNDNWHFNAPVYQF